MPAWPERPRGLISYAYINSDDALPADVDFLIDSGAFTAHTLGKSINLDEYMAYLDRHRGEYVAAFALDVIGNPDASLRNYRIMRRELPDEINIIPTWHVGSSLDTLGPVIDSGAPTVAIGGAVGYSNRLGSVMPTFIHAHKAASAAGVGLHGLGQTGSTAALLPWESVDSSSWTYPRRFPMVLLATRQGKIRSLKRGTRLSAADRTLVRAYGIPAADVERRTKAATTLSDKLSIAACRAYTYAGAVSPHGTHVYLAFSNMLDITTYIIPAHRAGAPYTIRSKP